MTEIIGRGEKISVELLREIFPDAEIITQVPLHKLIAYQFRIDLSPRQQKESIDIVVKRRHKKPLCIRIQDRHHFTLKMERIDSAQKHLLEVSYNDVVDIDEYECPQLFKEKNRHLCKIELMNYINKYI